MSDNSGSNRTAHVTTAGSSATVTAAITYLISPEGEALVSWLDQGLGSVGFVVLIVSSITCFFSAVANIVQWNRAVSRERFWDKRIKEKDAECHAEKEEMRNAWKAVVESKEADNKEAIQNVAKLIEQVTILTERAAPVRTRSH